MLEEVKLPLIWTELCSVNMIVMLEEAKPPPIIDGNKVSAKNMRSLSRENEDQYYN